MKNTPSQNNKKHIHSVVVYGAITLLLGCGYVAQADAAAGATFRRADSTLVETTTWAGYPADSNGNVDTDTWMGWINVAAEPFIYNWGTESWFHITEPAPTDPGTWAYFFRKPSLEDFLIAHYTFDGNANDQSGNGLDGTVSGATLTTDRFGNENAAYHVDGSSYITVEADDSYLNVDPDGWTLSFWVKPDEGQTERDAPIISYGWGDSGGYVVSYWEEYGMFRTSFYDFSWSGIYVSQDNLDDYTWYMYTITYNGETLKEYIDGIFIEESTGPYTPTTPEGTWALRFGAASNDSSGLYFKGSLDDIRLYAKVLSDAEIAEISGMSGAIRADKLNAYSLADFEQGTFKPAKYSNFWAIWGNDGNAYCEVVENPRKSGWNTSNYVGVSHTFPSLPLPDGTDCDKSEYVLTSADGMVTDQHHIMKWKLLLNDDNILHVNIVWTWMSFNQIHTGAENYPNGPGTTEDDPTIAWGGGIFNDLGKSSDEDPAAYEFRVRAVPDHELVPVQIQTKQWMTFTYEVVWTQSSNGYWRLWKDGELVGHADDVKTLPDSYDPATDDYLHFKTGLYNKWNDPVIDSLSLHFDDIELYIGDDIRVEDVAPECDTSGLN